jgi:hypothetical protein
MVFTSALKIPTVDKILFAVNDAPRLPHFKWITIYKLLRNIDFKFNKQKRSFI